jgi:hypothetical protein
MNFADVGRSGFLANGRVHSLGPGVGKAVHFSVKS